MNRKYAVRYQVAECLDDFHIFAGGYRVLRHAEAAAAKAVLEQPGHIFQIAEYDADQPNRCYAIVRWLQRLRKGDGVTVCLLGNRYPATVITVDALGKTLEVQNDAVHIGGRDDETSFEFERNPLGQVRSFTLRNNGLYIEKGGTLRRGTRLSYGRDYYNPVFSTER
jgi:hypothetical protein